MIKTALLAALTVIAVTANAQRADLESPGYYTVLENEEKIYHDAIVTGVLTMEGLTISINGAREAFVLNESVIPLAYERGQFKITRLAFYGMKEEHVEIEFSVNIVNGKKVIFCNIIETHQIRSFMFSKVLNQLKQI